ncbi:questin oxidase family protein [Rhizobium sp. S152]|uniref:questin oxidase family protein n=1 Tax=Rhizobium sp. S152 TaxID=3055038 RepID=UPI0025A95FAE|nr:questin oxidase family protein [Rhizobium sp. S152]MDM9627876.1 questin oxidase family protein [Rhizobium sp. S152]
MPQSALDTIMNEMPNYSFEFTKTFANHAPMVLVALDRIGGSADRLQAFFEHYRDYKELLPVPPVVRAIDATNWRAALGERSREADLNLFFKAEVDRLGAEAAIRHYLPSLAAGVGASAFHALMRLAYGLIRKSDTEIALALAYWTATYLPLPSPGKSPSMTREPAVVLEKVAAIESLRGLPLHELLWLNMAESGRCADFVPVVDWLEIDDRTLERMASAAIVLFAATMDFCALHAVTGVHWMRVVLPYCEEPQHMLRSFWQCIAALMGEMQFPLMPDPQDVEKWRALPVPDWETIKAAAAASYDEHDISLVFSANEEMKIYGDPLYQLAAARRVGLVASYT